MSFVIDSYPNSKVVTPKSFSIGRSRIWPLYIRAVSNDLVILRRLAKSTAAGFTAGTSRKTGSFFGISALRTEKRRSASCSLSAKSGPIL